jgi:hypothetical protein
MSGPSPDADASGMITVDRGLAVVGPIALDLSPYPQVSGSGLADWSHSYTLTSAELSLLAGARQSRRRDRTRPNWRLA